MRRFLLTVFVSLFTLAGFAQLNGDGYYRFQNVATQRYLYVYDNRGSVSIGSTSADLGAIQLWKNFDKAVSDPASVVYVTNVGGQYRFHCQGTDSYEIVGYDLRIIENNRAYEGTYSAYQSKNGMTSYLCDERTSDIDMGLIGTNVPSKTYKYWYIKPVTTGENYFGLTPEVTVGTDHYAPLFVEFPFSFAAAGMKAYYVSKVERGMAVIEEIANEVIPASTPLIVKCASSVPAENKLNLLRNSSAKIKGNQLQGVYFCNDVRGTHRNVTAYNPETMRLLALSAEGKLVFKKADAKYVPANKAYLQVPAGSPEEILVVTQKEFDDIIASGIDGVLSEQMHDERIFNLSGVVVGEGKAALKQLPAGVYIMDGKKHFVK